MTMTDKEKTYTRAGTPEAIPFSSNALRLSVSQWLLTLMFTVVLCVALPRLWPFFEDFAPEQDYRLPYALSDDYWLYRQYCQQSGDTHDVMVVGDSVVWGHYVPMDDSLSHYLNEMAAPQTFANMGIDGIHPAALAGLLKYYGQAIADKTVILCFNPLWMTSKKHDLQTVKEFRFNHPRLVPQFKPKIACYTESVPNKIGIVLERRSGLLSWTSHLRTAYYNKMDLPNWAMDHPYDCPVPAITSRLPQPQTTTEQNKAWNTRGMVKQTFPWVKLDSSVQWTFFKRAIETLHERGNTVFVLIGPFNEHMMTDTSLEAYHTIKAGIETWLKANKVPYTLPAPLPSELYADASHPLSEGYALLAQWLVEDASFKSVVLGSK
jgi:hypothetical protein